MSSFADEFRRRQKQEKEKERLKKQEAQQRLQSYQMTHHSLIEQVGMKQYKDGSRQKQLVSQQDLHSVQLNEVKINKNTNTTAPPSPSSSHVPDSERMKHDDDDLTFKSDIDKAGVLEWSPTRAEVPVKDMSPKSVTTAVTMAHDYVEDDGTVLTVKSAPPSTKQYKHGSRQKQLLLDMSPKSVTTPVTMAHDYVEDDGTVLTAKSAPPSMKQYKGGSRQKQLVSQQDLHSVQLNGVKIIKNTNTTAQPSPSSSDVPDSERMKHDDDDLTFKSNMDKAGVLEWSPTRAEVPVKDMSPKSVTMAVTMAHDYVEDDGTVLTAKSAPPSMKQYKGGSRQKQLVSQQDLHSVQLNGVKIIKNTNTTAQPSPSSSDVPDSEGMKHDDDDLTFKSNMDKAGVLEWSPTRAEVPVKDMSPKSVTMAVTMAHDYVEDDGTVLTAKAAPTFLATSLEEDFAPMEEDAQDATGIAPPPPSLVPPPLPLTNVEDEAASSGAGGVDDDDPKQPPRDGPSQQVAGTATTVTADNVAPATDSAAPDATSTVVTSFTDSTTPLSPATTTVETPTIPVPDATATATVPTTAAPTTHAPVVDETAPAVAAASETTVPDTATPESSATSSMTEETSSNWCLTCALFV